MSRAAVPHEHRHGTTPDRANWRRHAVMVLFGIGLLPVSASAQEPAGPYADARAHALAGRTERALSLYDSIRAIVPMDRAAAIGAATALAWGKRYAEAEERYRAVQRRWPDDLEAAQGLARVAAWRGDLPASEQRWRALVDRDPRNPDHWLGLAQVLRWQHRRAEALGVLERALAIAPAHEDARAERRRLYAGYANSIEPVIRYNGDSEGNSSWSALMVAEIPLASARSARIAVVERSAGLGLRAGRARGVEAGFEFALSELSALVVEAGASQLADAERPSRVMPSGRLRARWSSRDRLRVDASAGRAVLDETAPLIANAIVMDGLAVGAQLHLHSLWRLSMGGSLSTLRGGAVLNARREWDAALVAVPHGALEIGARVRHVGHAQVATDGYFSPRRHEIAEATLRWEPGQTVGWGARFEGAVGAQQVTLLGPAQRGPAQRAYVGVARRWELGGQLQIGYEFTSVAGIAPVGAAAPAGYRRHGVVASGRLPLVH